MSQFASMKVGELKEELTKRALDTTGVKAVLLKRLEDHEASSSSSSSSSAVKTKASAAAEEEQEESTGRTTRSRGSKRKAAAAADTTDNAASAASSKKTTTKTKNKKSKEKQEEDEQQAEAAEAEAEAEATAKAEEEEQEPAPKKPKRGGKGKAATSSAAAAAAAAKPANKTPKVDECCTIPGASVYEDYSATLNQTDIKNNNNKFYRIQLLTTGGNYYCWTHWGRVGETGQFDYKPGDLNSATKDFEAKFRDKTKNKWQDRENFQAVSGKYTLLDMDYSEDAEDSSSSASSSSSSSSSTPEYAPSKLEPSVRELVNLIFNVDMFREAMRNMNIDVKKMPLGKLSKVTLQKGYDALEALENEMKKSSPSQSALERLTSVFYTYIPHDFGRHKPPVLRSVTEVHAKVDMLNTLNDIVVAQDLQKQADDKKQASVKQLLANPLDKQYDTLNCDLEPVDPHSEEYDVIIKYLQNTKSPSFNVKVQGIFKVDRHDERSRFQQHASIKNRKLLWHGTNVAVVAAILSSGLRIMPHSGGRVGKGIYFASENAKSAGYVGSVGKTGIMFLNEVALGKEFDLVHDDSSLVRAPAGYDCIVARGHTEPDPAKDTTITIQGNKVTVPQGKPITTSWSDSNFSQSEYLVYKESQNRIRYLLRLEWPY